MRADLVLVGLADLAVRRRGILVVEVERMRDAGEHGERGAQQDQQRAEAKCHLCKPPVKRPLGRTAAR
jgi:hypothetical protein